MIMALRVLLVWGGNDSVMGEESSDELGVSSVGAKYSSFPLSLMELLSPTDLGSSVIV